MTAALNTSARPACWAHAIFALVSGQEQGRVVPLQTVLDDPSEFETRAAREGFKTLEAWAAFHETPPRVAFLIENWPLKQQESEETVFSDDVSEESFTDDSWKSGEESTDETYDPDKSSDAELSEDEFIDESE